MKILITAGGTIEYIDDVRVLTNISTGKLSAIIAEELKYLYVEDLSIEYIHSKNSFVPSTFIATGEHAIINYHETNSVDDLMKKMEELVPKCDYVIHAMAVSDFTFKKDRKLKIKSNDPEGFIEYMKKTISKTPKVLSFIKKWNPNCKLISFKFEVGLEHNELINIAKDSMNKNNSDVVIANDNEEMTKHKNHVAYFLTDNLEEKIEGKENIAKRIYNYIIDGK